MFHPLLFIIRAILLKNIFFFNFNMLFRFPQNEQLLHIATPCFLGNIKTNKNNKLFLLLHCARCCCNVQQLGIYSGNRVQDSSGKRFLI